jgi:hypothetical protein
MQLPLNEARNHIIHYQVAAAAALEAQSHFRPELGMIRSEINPKDTFALLLIAAANRPIHGHIIKLHQQIISTPMSSASNSICQMARKKIFLL